MVNPKEFKKKRSAPTELITESRKRGVEARHKIDVGKEVVREELRNGVLWERLQALGKSKLEQGDFMVLCGLHWNFLNGRNHKGTTKNEVRDFLSEINADLIAALADEPDIVGGSAILDSVRYLQLEVRFNRVKEDRDKLQDSLDRLRTRAHEWHLELRQALRIIRELKASSGLSVVHLRRHEPH